MSTAQRTAYRMCIFASMLAAAVMLALAALAPPSAAAAVSGAPKIVSTEWSLGGETLVGATIDPDGLATEYEVKLACAVCGPPGYAPATGELPTVQEQIAVSLNITGIEPGSYRFEVLAQNAAGNAYRSSEITVPEPPPGSCPEGCSSGGQYESEVPNSYIELSNAQATETRQKYEAEVRAKQQEESRAMEARYAAEEAEIKKAEEEEKHETLARRRREEEANHPPCVVPSLEGDTLAAARRALAKAHCRRGAVHRPRHRHHHHPLRVIRQGAREGTRLKHRAPVALWLGVREHSAKAGSRRRRATCAPPARARRDTPASRID